MRQTSKAKQNLKAQQKRPSPHPNPFHHGQHEGAKRPLHPSSLLQLQQQMGNSHVQRLLVQRDSGPETPEQQGRQQFQQGLTHFRANEFAQALALWRQIYNLSQLDDNIRKDMAIDMGICHLRLGQNEQAIAMFQEYLLFEGADHPMALEHIRRARTDEALPPVGQAIPEVTDEQREAADAQAQQAIEAGNAAGETGDFAGGLEQFRLAYSLQAASSELRWRATWSMGFAHRRLGQFEEAISVWQESLAFSEAGETARLQVIELIRQARLGVIDPDDETTTTMTETEQRTQFQAARTALGNGQYEAALAGFRAIYAQPTADLNVRQMMAFDMALCHHRLQQFDQAIALYEEYLLFPSISDSDREGALEKIRQCRNQEIGMHITPGNPDADTAANERELFNGFVFFETGSRALGSEGEETMNYIAQLLREQQAAHPNLTFRIVIVGASTRRWQSASNEEQVEEQNRILAEGRATNAATFLTEHLPDDAVASGVFQTETSGTSDDVSELLGLDPEDNNWTERHAAITVLMREGSEQTAE